MSNLYGRLLTDDDNFNRRSEDLVIVEARDWDVGIKVVARKISDGFKTYNQFKVWLTPGSDWLTHKGDREVDQVLIGTYSYKDAPEEK
jgi:hypothetical protein